MVRCDACGQDNPYGERTCGACQGLLRAGGFPLTPTAGEGLGVVCPRCDVFALLEAESCAACGATFIAGDERPAASAKPRLARKRSLTDTSEDPERAPYEVEGTSPGSSTSPNFAAVGIRMRKDSGKGSGAPVPAPLPSPRVEPTPMPLSGAPRPTPVPTKPGGIKVNPLEDTRGPEDGVGPAPMPRTTARSSGPGPRPGESTRPCPKCGATVPNSFLFCGRCGIKVPIDGPATADALGQTQFFGQLQAVGKAKLVLIKGEGLDGISYQLNAEEHIAGRSEGVILFPDDRFLSPRHANFFYRDGQLFIRDEGSVNGVFIRIREPVPLRDGDTFLAGEELHRFELMKLPRPAEMVSADGTVFYGTPMRDGIGCRLVQILLGGRRGLLYVPSKAETLLGREACDLNFPRDRFISGRHSKLARRGEDFFLSDMGSKNGTYLRMREERALQHGDYVFLGQQLFRVEITAF